MSLASFGGSVHGSFSVAMTAPLGSVVSRLMAPPTSLRFSSTSLDPSADHPTTLVPWRTCASRPSAAASHGVVVHRENPTVAEHSTTE